MTMRAAGCTSVYNAAFAAAISLSAAVAVAPSPLHAQTGELVGQVVERGTHQPVAGAHIRLAGQDAASDSAGMFRITGIPSGRHRLDVIRPGYSPLNIDVRVESDRTSRIRLDIDVDVITLAPLDADALSYDTRRDRGAGYVRGVVPREELAKWEGTAMSFPDVLRTVVPSVRIRRLERVVGSDVCIELRSIRVMGAGQCLSPKVYLDGVPITNPTMLFAGLQTRLVESVEVVPAAEAGVRFGTDALYGALLIETRRPGVRPQQRAEPLQPNFDWSSDPAGHSTGRVLIASAVGNAVGLAVGLSAARSCLGLRAPSNDGIVSNCSVAPAVASGLAAIALPAVGAGGGARLGGATASSRGRFLPSAIASAMVVLPGYALALSARRNDSEGLEWLGAALITVGAPAAATLADYLFRDRN